MNFLEESLVNVDIHQVRMVSGIAELLWDLPGPTDAQSLGFRGLASAFLHLSTGEGRILFPQQAAGSFSCLLCQVGIEAVYVGAVPI